jgi:NitT/TauT family transport system substrate-binding protein
MRIRTPLIAALMTGALALTGCATQGSRAAAGGPDGGPVTIFVGGQSKVIYLPAKLTEQLGYFRDEGVDVTLVDTAAGVTAETALVAGQAQGVVGFYDHTIDLQAKGKCTTSIVQFANVPGEAEMVPAASTITGPEDFAGRKLGVTSTGSSTDFLTQYLASRGGVPTSGYTTVQAGADAKFIAAMTSGGIDAGMTTDPTVSRLVQTGQGKVLIDMRTAEGTAAALGGLYPASSLYVSCDWLAQHPQTAQKLANAFVRTLRFIGANDGAAIAATMPADYSSGDPALYTKALDDSKQMFTRDGVIDAAGARNVLAVLGSTSPSVKPLKDTIDVTRTYTTQFVQAVPAASS